MARQTAKAVKAELVTTPLQVVTDIQVTTSDVMAIGMVEVETRLEERAKDLGLQMKAKEKEVSQLNDKIQNHKLNRVKEHFALATKALEEAFKVAGFKATVRVDVGGSTITDDVETFYGNLTISNGSYSTASRQDDFVANADHVQMMKDKGQANLELVKIREQLVETKLELSKLPSLERKYRAELAKVQLNQSAQGRELLAQMQANTTSHLDRLRLTSK